MFEGALENIGAISVALNPANPQPIADISKVNLGLFCANNINSSTCSLILSNETLLNPFFKSLVIIAYELPCNPLDLPYIAPLCNKANLADPLPCFPSVLLPKT